MSVPEDLIRASKLDKTQIERLRSTYEKAAQAPSAAGLIPHGPNDIPSMGGLGGQFLWPENPLAPATVSFTIVTTDPQGVADGTYTSAPLVGGTVERGNFHAVPTNPLIGFPFIELMPQGAIARFYTVQFAVTDVNGKILNMQLKNATSQQEFWAVRMSP